MGDYFGQVRGMGGVKCFPSDNECSEGAKLLSFSGMCHDTFLLATCMS